MGNELEGTEKYVSIKKTEGVNTLRDQHRQWSAVKNKKKSVVVAYVMLQPTI